MSLQPIVENAVKHGAGLKLIAGQPFTITIVVRLEGDALLAEIADDGVGMAARKVGELNEKLAMSELEFQRTYGASESGGIGLRNVHQRIRLHYGPECGLRISSGEGRFTKVTMRMPAILLSGGYAEHA